MNMSEQVLDWREQYVAYNKIVSRMNGQFFGKLIAIDTYPTSSQPYCYLIIPERLGSIYEPLVHHISSVVGGEISLQEPDHLCVAYLRKANRVLQEFYMINTHDHNHNPNLQIVLEGLFGRNYEKYRQLYRKYIKDSQTNLEFLKTTLLNASNFRQSSVLNRLRLRSHANTGYNQVLNKLNSIPYQVGDCRLQPLIQMSRQLNGIYGVQLTGSKLQPNHQRKILIKCNLPFHKTYKQKERTQQQFQQSFLNVQFIKNLNQVVQRLFHLKDKNHRSYKKNHQIAQQNFLRSMCEKLIEIEMVTGKPHPCLEQQNILFYNNLLKPFLSIDPYIIQALGFKAHNEELSSQSNSLTDFLKNSNQNKLLYFTYFLQHLEKFEYTQNLNAIKNQASLLMGIRKKQEQNQQKQKHKNQIDDSKKGSMMNELLMICTTKVPSLFVIDQQLKFNSHISDMSPKKFEYVLWMRYKMMKLLSQTTGNIQNQVKKCDEKQSKKDKLTYFMKQMQFYNVIFRLLLCLVSLQFRQILRSQDAYAKKQLVQYCDNNNLFSIKIVLQNLKCSNNVNIEWKQLFLDQMIVLTHQLSSISQNKLLINYSKTIRKILLFIQKSIDTNKLQSHIRQLIQHCKQTIKVLYFSHLCHIIVLLMLKMDHYNIFRCDHFYYRKLRSIFESQIKTKDKEEIKKTLVRMQNDLEQMGEGDDSVWSGQIWPKADQNK